MTTLSSKRVSLSDHVKRRRSAAVSGSGYGGGSSGGGSSDGTGRRGSSSAAQHSRPEYEGAYDSHAASYGNYDAPSAHCRIYGLSEHGCYAAESHIGSGGYSQPRIKPSRRDSHSDSEIDMDLEGQRCAADITVQPSYTRKSSSSSRQRRPPKRAHSYSADYNYDPALRMSQASTVHMGPQEYCSSSFEEESSYYPKSQASVSTASTASSSGSSSISSGGGSTVRLEEEAIRQGIVDLSTLVATYIAGALSFVIGIFLALLSPCFKVFKMIVGDVRGLLGDVGFVQDLGSLWRTYKELRRRGERSNASHVGSYHRQNSCPHPQQYRQHYDDRRYDDASTEATSIYTDMSPQPAQYVGGWAPKMGGSSAASGVSANSGSTGTGSGPWARRKSSRSYSSLPLVREDGRGPEGCHQSSTGSAPLGRHVQYEQRVQSYQQQQYSQQYPASSAKIKPLYYSPQRSGRMPRSRSGVV